MPLADLVPEWRHPLTGARLAEIAARLAVGAGVRVRAESLPWSLSEAGSQG